MTFDDITIVATSGIAEKAPLEVGDTVAIHIIVQCENSPDRKLPMIVGHVNRVSAEFHQKSHSYEYRIEIEGDDGF